MPPRSASSSTTTPVPLSPHAPSPALDEAKAAEATLTKAAQQELSGNYDAAFRLYVTAAQSFLHLSRALSSPSTSTSIAPTAADQARYKASAKRALDRAEKIKAHKRDVRPVARERLSTASQASVLDRSAAIGGRRYPVWDDSSPSSTMTNGSKAFEDPDGLLSLSAAQRASLAQWARPPIPVSSADLHPQDLVQETITDCSVVAALVVCVAHNRRHGSRLGVECLCPQNSDGLPKRSESGRYDVRLFMNGGARKVTIDDRLPVRASGCLLCVSTRGRKALWPSLVEKAYLKVRGGYDFEGSNGAIDLHAITGWIPEHLRIVDAKFQREKAWRRLLPAFQAGHCLMTVGTGKSPGTFGKHKLTPFHAYAVIGLFEEGTEQARVVELWNPWGRRAEGGREREYTEGPIRMEWDDLCGIFDSIYLNWDPGIFLHKAVVHSAWQPNQAQKGDEPWTSNHQYNVTFSAASAAEPELWMLLSRHTTGKDEDHNFVAGHVFHAAEADSMSVRPALEATYTDSPHVLVRTSRLTDESVLSIITSRHGTGSGETAYTLSVFSAAPFTLSEPTQVYSFSQWLDGSFTGPTAGGNSLHPTFMRNPQYALTVKPALSGGANPDGVHLRLQVHGSKDLPLHVQILWGRGERVFDVRQTKAIKDSGTYNYGFGLCEAQIPVGTYTVIVSSFEPGALGEYKLQVECSEAFDVRPIPQEGAGMFSRRLQGRWTTSSRNPAFELTLEKPTIVTARLQLLPPASMTPIKLSLTAPSDRHSAATVIAHSGDYTDSVAGAVIQNARVGSGTYSLLPSIVSAQVEADFIIQVYSTACSIKCKQL